MSRELIHLYGNLSIQSFGTIITVGLLLFVWLVHRNPRRKALMSSEQFSRALLVGVIAGIVGGRLLYVAEEYHSMNSLFDVFRFWEGGFAILGTIIAVLLALAIYLKNKKIPLLPFFDLVAIYGPLLQSISRLGCLAAGCCYGKACSSAWAVTYTDPNSIAPTHVPLHPTPLYSTIALFLLFLFMKFIAARRLTVPGQLITLYLLGASAVRFTVDFWRADREFFSAPCLAHLSMHQWIALCIGTAALCAFIVLSIRDKQTQS
ncbi:prolipoprotein diacylglyceryl transferase [Candidatus Dependentiae bacterium]